jgi:integrase
MSSISTDQQGNRRILFVDPGGNRRTLYLGPMPKKAVETIQVRVDELLAAQLANTAIGQETAAWLGKLDARLRKKLEKAGLAELADRAAPKPLRRFIDDYLETRKDITLGTRQNYLQAKRYLVEFFGADRLITKITEGDAEELKVWLTSVKGLAENTARKWISCSKTYFGYAVKKRMIHTNPMAKLKSRSFAVKDRRVFISKEDSERVLAACPDAEWRLIFALSRYGGLRCPSELLELRWADVNWDAERFEVHSPKTKRHEGHESRWVPLFPELRPHFEAAREAAEPGSEYVVNRYRSATQNLRTQLHRIIRRAGLTPWPKPFQNLRSTRETELGETFPIQAVCAWIGNSEAVARDHYLQVTEAHFQRAVQSVTTASAATTATTANSTNCVESTSEKTTQIPTQQAAVSGRNVSQDAWRAEKKSHDCGQKQGPAKNREPLRNQGLPLRGFEPRLTD